MIYLPRVTHTAKGGQVDDLVTQSHTHSKRGPGWWFSYPESHIQQKGVIIFFL